MAHYDSTSGATVKMRPRWDEQFYGWLWFDCGCSGGLAWGGESPRYCSDCKGNGWLAVHVSSRRVARWPGGPFIGWTRSEADMERLLAAVHIGGSET